MAQIVTITNPLTGQPAQVDQLDHTAQEIDDAIARSLPGGAIDTALQNKAPAGYGGFGEKIPHKGSFTSDESFVEWLTTEINSLPSGASEQIRFALYNYDNWSGADWYGVLTNESGYGTLLVSSYGSVYNSDFPAQMIRRFVNNVWNPWEWVNPPMIPGVEYRTTERYLGKPVYVQTKEISALAIGSSSSSARTDISNFTEACDKIVRYEMYVTPASGGPKYPIPYIDAGNGVLKASGSLNEGQYLYGSIYTFDDLSKYKANVTCWYTKTTD